MKLERTIVFWMCFFLFCIVGIIVCVLWIFSITGSPDTEVSQVSEDLKLNSNIGEPINEEDEPDHMVHHISTYSQVGEALVEKALGRPIEVNHFGSAISESETLGLGNFISEFKITGDPTEQTYEYRLRFDLRDGTIYYFNIEGETVYWDEEGEDACIDAAGDSSK